MKTYFLSITILLSFFSVSIRKENTNRLPKMPVWVAYIKNQPPDSIQQFVKLYLQSKKIEVISMEAAIKLHAEVAMENATKLMEAGNFSEKTAKTVVEEPVSNILRIRVFSDTLNKNDYKIDSIYWHINVLPTVNASVKDIKFMPSYKTSSDPFLILKDFLDEVLTSKRLK